MQRKSQPGKIILHISNSQYLLSPQRENHDEMFTVLVGDGTIFNVEKSILNGCPVFASMCNGPFLENENKLIDLPDDDADAFALLVDYLKASHLGVPGHMKRAARYPERLSELYILANKYRMAELEELIVQSFESFYLNYEVFNTRTGIRFFNIGEKVYDNVVAVNDPFKTWFRPMISIVLKDADNNLKNHVKEIVHEGGGIAADIYAAQDDALTASRSIVKGVSRVLTTGIKEGLSYY